MPFLSGTPLFHLRAYAYSGTSADFHLPCGKLPAYPQAVADSTRSSVCPYNSTGRAGPGAVHAFTVYFVALDPFRQCPGGADPEDLSCRAAQSPAGRSDAIA